MPFQPGDLLDGKYRLIERLGAGGMGEVYKAEHVLLGTTRVIKVVRPQISSNTEAHERFLREARLATRVQHPNVATLHDFAALPDGAHYMVWELIDGENVGQILRRRGTLPPSEATRIAIQALHGLDAIHRAGIIHRDISPENLMVTRDGQVKIIDLGVAKGLEGDSTMTQTGMFVGKLRYASPEHLGILNDKERIDARADLYSLGIVLYEMLAGRPPFEATSPHQYYLHYSREDNVRPPDLAPIPQPLRPVLARALERDRNRRFKDANEFAAALERVPFGDDAPTQITPMPTMIDVQRKRSRALPLTIAAVVVLAILAIVTMRPWSSKEAAPPTATATVAPAKPAQTTVESTAPRVAQASQPAAPVTPTTTTTEAQARKPAPHEEERPAAAPPPAVATTTHAAPPPPAPPPALHVATYFDGKGDSSHNDEAVSYAKKQLQGVTRVALDASGDPDLQSRLRELLQHDGLTISDAADVVIRFNGSVQRQRFGRKNRQGSATITRGGRVVFRYELPSEEYRVGDNPAEAFARVAADLFR